MSGEARDGQPLETGNFPGIINEVFRSRWEFREGASGVPERMGGHLMPSGEHAPYSTSLGQGREVFKHVFQYTDSGSPWGLQVHPAGGGGLQAGLAAEVKRCYDEAVEAKGSFVCALSGGSLVNLLGALAGQEHGMDWGKWHVLWADERLVPLDHADSNYRGAREAFLSLTSIPDAQVHAIDAALPVDQAALLYEVGMRRMGPEVLPPSAAAPSFPAIDLVLLGVGPDGHVASLFPNMVTVTGESEKWVVGVQNSPKPPPERISLTLPVLLQALLSQSHRVRALLLLRRFLSLGGWAVQQALNVGIFQYVAKLLHSSAAELRLCAALCGLKIVLMPALYRGAALALGVSSGATPFLAFIGVLPASASVYSLASTKGLEPRVLGPLVPLTMLLCVALVLLPLSPSAAGVDTALSAAVAVVAAAALALTLRAPAKEKSL